MTEKAPRLRETQRTDPARDRAARDSANNDIRTNHAKSKQETDADPGFANNGE